MAGPHTNRNIRAIKNSYISTPAVLKIQIATFAQARNLAQVLTPAQTLAFALAQAPALILIINSSNKLY